MGILNYANLGYTGTIAPRTTDTQRLNLKFFAAQIKIPLQKNIWELDVKA